MPRDPHHGKCNWSAAGIGQCQYPAPYSNATNGSGPWYCAWHFNCPDRGYGDEIVRQSLNWDGTADSYRAMRLLKHTRNNPAAKKDSSPEQPPVD